MNQRLENQRSKTKWCGPLYFYLDRLTIIVHFSKPSVLHIWFRPHSNETVSRVSAHQPEKADFDRGSRVRHDDL